MKKFMRMGLLLLFIAICFCPHYETKAAEPGYVEPNDQGAWFYAGGYPIKITAGKEANSTTIYCDKEWTSGKPDGVYETTVKENWPDSNYLYVVGGALDQNVTSTDILMEGGQVDLLIGGGWTSGEGKKAEVTGEARIMVNDGIIGQMDSEGKYFTRGCLFGGGDNENGGDVSVNESMIRVNGGLLNAIYANGKKAQDKEGTNIVYSSSIEIYGGTVYNGAYGDVGSEASVKKLERYVIEGASVICYENIGNYDHLPKPKNKSGAELYSLSLFLEKDQKKVIRRPVESVIKDDGKTINLSHVVTTNKGQIDVWIPLGTRITGAISKNEYFTANKETGYSDDSYTHDLSHIFSNLVKAPVVITYAPTYFTYEIKGFSEVNTSVTSPYTVVSGVVSAVDAGTYTTVFRLKKEYPKWEDGTSADKSFTWSIKKGDRSAPSNLWPKQASSSKIADGSITGVSNEMEYSTDQNKWISLAGLPEGSTELKNLAVGTYYIRYRENNNRNASPAKKIGITSAAPICTLYDYEGKKKLEEFEGTPIKNDAGQTNYRFYIPAKYSSYAIFEEANGKKTTSRLKEDAQGSYLSGVKVYYLLQPTYVERKPEIALDGGRQITIGYKADNDEDIKALVLSSNEGCLAYFFHQMIMGTYNSGEFGQFKNLTEAKKKALLLGNTYYVRPCSAKEADQLSNYEKNFKATYTPDSKVFPHLSLTQEEGSVMKINLIDPAEGEDFSIKLVFSSVEHEGVEKVLVADMGNYPGKGSKNLFIAENPTRNIVFTTGTLTVTYGQKKDAGSEEQKPGGDSESGGKDSGSDGTGQGEGGKNPGGDGKASGSDVSNPGSDGNGSGSDGKNPGQDETLVSGNGIGADVADVATTEKQILSFNTDKADLPGATQRYLYLKFGKITKNSLTLKWKKVKGADGYIIYGAKCGKKMRRLKTIEKSAATSCKLKKLKKGTYYKYMVIAYKKGETEDQVLTLSPSVHATTTGGKYGNPTGLSVQKKGLKVPKKKVRVKAKVKSKKKVREHIAKLRFESLNPKIATVSKKGVIKGRKKGKAKILVYTQNGICKKVTVRVK